MGCPLSQQRWPYPLSELLNAFVWALFLGLQSFALYDESMNSLWENIIHWHGKISDHNVIWFPYTFLRPKPHQFIGLKQSVIIMPALWGLYMGLPYGLFFMFAKGWPILDVALFIAKFTLFFLFWFNAVTRPLWNARARRLSSQN